MKDAYQKLIDDPDLQGKAHDVGLNAIGWSADQWEAAMELNGVDEEAFHRFEWSIEYETYHQAVEAFYATFR